MAMVEGEGKRSKKLPRTKIKGREGDGGLFHGGIMDGKRGRLG